MEKYDIHETCKEIEELVIFVIVITTVIASVIDIVWEVFINV